MSAVYLDTSALAKWYLNEARSDDVEEYLQAVGPARISTLTVVELRALLARRRRSKDFDAATEARVFATFEDDVRLGSLIRHPVDDVAVQGAASMLALLPGHALRTLDALHLSVARGIGADTLATADRVMGDAAEELGLTVVRFD